MLYDIQGLAFHPRQVRLGRGSRRHGCHSHVREGARVCGGPEPDLAKRLRDEAPFTLDDLDAILEALGQLADEMPADFVRRAEDRHGERVMLEMEELRAAARRQAEVYAAHPRACRVILERVERARLR